MAIDLVAVLRLDDQITQSLKKVALGATAGFAAITAGAAASVAKFAEIDSQLRMAGAVAGATSSEFEALKQATIDLGSSSTKSMGEIAESFTEMAASGFEVNEAIAAMPGIIKASEASGESLALAAENVSAALNIWSLEASDAGKVADILTMSANVSAAGIVDLGQALKYAGAPAAVLGMDLASVSAAIGVMVDSGIDGSSAGTSLRAALLALNNPANAQEKIMKSLGFSIRDASGEAKSLVDIVADMTKATEHMTAADRLATVGKLVGTEAASGFLTLMSRGPEELQAMTDALRDSAGIAEETANRINQGLGALFKSIGSKKEALMFQIGDALDPIASRIADVITKIDFKPLIAATSKVSDAMASAFDVFKNNWKTLGPIITPILGLLGSFVAVLGLIGGGVAVFAALSAVIGFISGPIALIAAGITLIGAGFVVAYKHFKPFRDGIQNGLQKIKDFVTTFKQVMKGGLLTGILNRDKTAVALAVMAANTVKNIGKQIQKVKDFIVTTKQILNGGLLTGILDRDKDAVAWAVAFSTNLKAAFEAIKVVMDPIVENIKEKFSEMKSAFEAGGMGGLLSSILPPGMYEKIVDFVNTIKSQLGEVIPFIKEKFEQMRPTFEMLQNAFKKVQGVVMEVFPAVWSVLEPILTNIWSSIQRVADVATWAFNNIIVPGLALLSAAFSAVWSIIGPILELIGAAIKLSFEVLKIVWDAVIAPFAESLTGIFAKAVEFAIPIVEKIGGVFEKIGGLISTAASKISNFAETLKSVKVPGWIGKIGSGAASFASNIFGGGKKDGSHYNGIGRIGWDGYIAELHAGERVLNRFEADQYDAIMGGEMQVAGVSDFKHEARSVNNTTINQNTTNSSGIDAKPTQGSTSISIAKLADQITVREDADITRIADEFVAKILEKRGVTA